MIEVMTTASTKPEPVAPPPDSPDNEKVARAAREVLATQLVGRTAGRWPTSDQITILGREITRSIDRYERVHHRAPTWADALADVDQDLLAPIRAVPDGWPFKPARWRLALRQHLMIELRGTRWIAYNRTTRSLQPGEQGRGWLRTARPAGGALQHAVEEARSG